MLFTCIKSRFFRNHLANFHQISHWSFCWNVIDSLFKWSCSIDCQAHIFFFKTKNCSNDDIFISCDDRIGKMLHNVCMSAVAMSLRWANRGPWASCSSCHVKFLERLFFTGSPVLADIPTQFFYGIWVNALFPHSGSVLFRCPYKERIVRQITIARTPSHQSVDDCCLSSATQVVAASLPWRWGGNCDTKRRGQPHIPTLMLSVTAGCSLRHTQDNILKYFFLFFFPENMSWHHNVLLPFWGVTFYMGQVVLWIWGELSCTCACSATVRDTPGPKLLWALEMPFQMGQMPMSHSNTCKI